MWLEKAEDLGTDELFYPHSFFDNDTMKRNVEFEKNNIAVASSLFL